MSQMTSQQIHVVGLGVNAEASLLPEAEVMIRALPDTGLLIGSERQLAMVSRLSPQAAQLVLPKLSELQEVLDEALQNDTKQVVILASGDPLYFGVGAWVKRHFSQYSMVFYPNVSSIQAACHQIGLSLQEAEVVSVHGRPLASLRRHLHQGRRLVLLTDAKSHPRAIAQECVDFGLSQSQITVCERLGYADQRVTQFSAESLAKQDTAFDPLNVVIVETSDQLARFPATPGFKDELFVTDKGDGKGMITKREVRLAILSYLGAEAGEVIWDIGAGCGGVAIELAYWNAQSGIYAVEHHPERFACLEQNRDRFGVVQNLTTVNGRAPQALGSLPSPNRVFVGGSDGEMAELLETVWQRLPLGGVLLVSSVTDATQMAAMAFLAQRDAQDDAMDESVTLQVQRSERLAGSRMRRPHLPVTLWRFEKKRFEKRQLGKPEMGAMT